MRLQETQTDIQEHLFPGFSAEEGAQPQHEPDPGSRLLQLECDDLLPLVLLELDGDGLFIVLALHPLADSLQKLLAFLLRKLFRQLLQSTFLWHPSSLEFECITRRSPIPIPK